MLSSASIFWCILVAFWYIFSAFTSSSVLVTRRISLLLGSSFMFSSTDESLKDETCKLVPWDGLLVKLHTFVVFIHDIFEIKPVHISITRTRASKSFLMGELCFNRFQDFNCLPIYIFSFNHEQCPGALIVHIYYVLYINDR